MKHSNGKRPLEIQWRRWEDNIKTDLQKIKWKCMDWITLAQNRHRWRALECGNEPSGSIKCEKFID